jgi:anti-sigma B factor antagonist
MPTRLAITDIDPNGVALRGEIDAHSAPGLADRFSTLPAGDDDVVIDMAEVSFMDSSGLRVLLDLHQRAGQAGRRLVLLTPSQTVTRLLEVSGLLDHFIVEPAPTTDSN